MMRAIHIWTTKIWRNSHSLPTKHLESRRSLHEKSYIFLFRWWFIDQPTFDKLLLFASLELKLVNIIARNLSSLDQVMNSSCMTGNTQSSCWETLMVKSCVHINIQTGSSSILEKIAKDKLKNWRLVATRILHHAAQWKINDCEVFQEELKWKSVYGRKKAVLLFNF